MPLIPAAELERMGLSPEAVRNFNRRTTAAIDGLDLADPSDQVRAWDALRPVLLSDPAWRGNFDVHRAAYDAVYRQRRPADGPRIAWAPTPSEVEASNLAAFMAPTGQTTYEDLHRWSVEHRDAFWTAGIRMVGITLRSPLSMALPPSYDPKAPAWLPGQRMNIVESCFHADPGRTAITAASEEAPELRQMTYGELRELAARVASGLEGLGIGRGDRIALYLPMTPESVAIYLGIVAAGAVAVGIADASAPPEFAKRARIADARAVFTIESYRRDGKDQAIYEKVVAASGPRAVVLPREGRERADLKRPDDVQWRDFLGSRTTFAPVECEPSDPTNILFSSGTTKDPKAIVWTHVTPIKCAADGYFHHDVHESDVLAWPTSFGWMMGPWLTYASLVNRASMALYVGAPQRREFGGFVQDAGVTMLGAVPKLVRAWKESRAMEGLDWGRIRLFSSTAEPSTPEEMFYLMFLAGYKPVVEYCGGTEIGGAYITGTVVQPGAPGMFTTPALGLDIVILDEGKPANRGEVFLVPPSIGLSNTLLNYDHEAEYFGGVPQGPNGEILRRHGDQVERLPGGFYRHHGRIDDVINLNGVKTSSEEIRSAIANEAVYDAKPIAVDVEGTGQASLVVFVVPKDAAKLASEELRATLRREFQQAIKQKLNPLLAHVHDVVLVADLPQAGPGKTRTMTELRKEYAARRPRPTGGEAAAGD